MTAVVDALGLRRGAAIRPYLLDHRGSLLEAAVCSDELDESCPAVADDARFHVIDGTTRGRPMSEHEELDVGLRAADGLFPQFRSVRPKVSQGWTNVLTGGSGPPVLLLHGYPQTRTAWYLVAPRLAAGRTVVLADLPGYGDTRPGSCDGSKRMMAGQLVELMRSLGHERFAVVGHDRGGRVAYRMALDHPNVVTARSV